MYPDVLPTIEVVSTTTELFKPYQRGTLAFLGSVFCLYNPLEETRNSVGLSAGKGNNSFNFCVNQWITSSTTQARTPKKENEQNTLPEITNVPL